MINDNIKVINKFKLKWSFFMLIEIALTLTFLMSAFYLPYFFSIIAKWN